MNKPITQLFFALFTAILVTGCLSSSNSDSVSKSKETELVVIFGITGNQGGGVADAVLADGFKVRGISRNINSDASKALISRGVEMVQGDFNDFDSVKAAVEGADHLFVNITEQTPNFVAAANHAFDAASAAGAKHMVFTSNIIANPESGFQIDNENHKRSIELHLRQSGYSYTTLRIPFMMENVMRERDMQTVLAQGTVDYGVEGTPGYYISSGDMGVLAAAAFSDPISWNGREVNMASDAVTPKELAALISKLSGFEIQYRTAPWSEMRGRFAANFRWFEEGNPSYDLVELRQEFPTLQTLEEYLISNNYGDKIREVQANPPAVQEGGGMARPGGMGG